MDPAADLSLTKSDSPDPVLAGELLTYTLDGRTTPVPERDRRELTDTLPAGVTFDSATPSQGSCSEASGTVTCALGTIADGQSASVEIKVTPQSAGHDHEPGERQLRPGRSRLRPTTPRAPRRPSTRPPTCR